MTESGDKAIAEKTPDVNAGSTGDVTGTPVFTLRGRGSQNDLSVSEPSTSSGKTHVGSRETQRTIETPKRMSGVVLESNGRGSECGDRISGSRYVAASPAIPRISTFCGNDSREGVTYEQWIREIERLL
jgi:hypothetical protein